MSPTFSPFRYRHQVCADLAKNKRERVTVPVEGFGNIALRSDPMLQAIRPIAARRDLRPSGFVGWVHTDQFRIDEVALSFATDQKAFIDQTLVDQGDSASRYFEDPCQLPT